MHLFPLIFYNPACILSVMEQKEWDDCADDYHSYIISPFQENAKNPIYRHLEAMQTKGMVVADLGCGRGDFLPYLSKRFKEVHAFDFSSAMLDHVRKRQGHLKNVKIEQADIRDFRRTGQYDVLIAANSILMPSIRDVNKALKNIHNSLKSGGRFIGIFPSMDSVVYYFTLVYERERERFPDEKSALRNTRRLAERKKYNVVKGLYDDNGDRQKFYYRTELENRLLRAGFRDIRMHKVIYPWGDESGDFDDFHGNLELWDWYAICKRP